MLDEKFNFKYHLTQMAYSKKGDYLCRAILGPETDRIRQDNYQFWGSLFQRPCNFSRIQYYSATRQYFLFFSQAVTLMPLGDRPG